ncbi:MAG: hypothetical protein WC520_02020 [Candidatus Paceibacterota bacterium]
MKITKKTVLADVMGNEKAEELLGKYNVPCLSCPYAQSEMNELELGQICETYGIDCEKLIEELNVELNK